MNFRTARHTVCCIAVASAAALSQAQTPPPTELRVHAAGSLRMALDEAAAAFEAAHPGVRVKMSYGASGLLKDRLLAGEPGDVYASANMEHPQALAAAGKAGPVRRFARNTMCVLARPGVELTAATAVDRLLDPALTLGTSTPRADPAGDYAFQVFDRIEAAGHPGAARTLAAKAQQLTGGAQSAPPPTSGRSAYGELVAGGKVDLFVTYCTGAVAAVREQPALQWARLPDAVNVAADYGVTVLAGAKPAAQQYVDALLAPAAQALLARHGFSTP